MSNSGPAIAHVPSRLLEVENLEVLSRIDGVERRMVAGVSFTVKAGEALAIVGESGSGKSLTARSVMGLLPNGLEARGSVRYDGREILGLPEKQLGVLRGGEMTMILQDPFTMLHPMRRCGTQITETLRDDRGRRLSKRNSLEQAVLRLREVGIEDERVARRYPFELSGGMRQRVAIAAALAQNPRLLIADEPSTALDVTTQQEILDLLRELQASRDMALVLITHDLRVAFSVCDRMHVFYAGSIAEVGPAAAVAEQPLHPYTLGLLLAEPPIDRRLEEMRDIPGSVPSPDEVAGRCSFADRCTWVSDECLAGDPPLVLVGETRGTTCVRVHEIAGEMAAAHRAAEQPSAPVLASEPADAQLLMVRDLEVVYGKARRADGVHALRGISIALAEGESVGLVGESGSGKTTLGRCLTGLVTATSGSIAIDGIDASNYATASSGDRKRLRHAVQMVFQDPYSSLNPVRSVGATLGEALALRLERSPRTEEIAALLERVGLAPDYARRKPVALSGGERQRVAIARAIALEPRLIVCDEPVSALDVSVQAQMLNLLNELRRQLGFAYLFITHDLAVVRQVTDRVYVLYRGDIVESGSTDSVLDDPKHEYTRRLVDCIPTSDAAGAIADAPRVG